MVASSTGTFHPALQVVATFGSPMSQPHRLSKSRFMSGRQCMLRLWNEWFHRDLATPADAATQARFDEGNDVGELARKRFPGVLVAADHRQSAAALADTNRLVADPTVSAIHEAAFEHQGAFVRVDTLVRRKGAWDVIEVKSVLEVEAKHRMDAAYQGWVVAGAGLPVGSISVMALNKEYRYQGGDLDLVSLFRLEDITAEAKALVPCIEADLIRFQALLQQPEAPAVLPGVHCSTPYPCPFFAHCTRHWPSVPDPVDWLPGFGPARCLPLHAAGSHSMADLPLVELNARQVQVVACHQKNQPWVSDAITEALQDFEPPIHFLDFETFAPALPRLMGTGPREKVPVQWSCHTMLKEGLVTHREFLAEGDSDPREAFALSLLEAVETEGRICVYSPYEKGVLSRLAVSLPHLAPGLIALVNRLVDLLPIVKEHIYLPAFQGSYSIKEVLPALVPGFDYSHLEVHDGLQAGVVFARMLDETNPAAKQALRDNLLAYCGQDTLAMVKIRAALKSF